MKRSHGVMTIVESSLSGLVARLDELRQTIKTNKVVLLALLAPSRSTGREGCLAHWCGTRELYPKSVAVPTVGPGSIGARYCVQLFGRWCLVRFEPTIGEAQASVVDADRGRRMFGDLHEFCRWAWAEAYAPELQLPIPN